jgi:hypothetical protein
MTCVELLKACQSEFPAPKPKHHALTLMDDGRIRLDVWVDTAWCTTFMLNDTDWEQPIEFVMSFVRKHAGKFPPDTVKETNP